MSNIMNIDAVREFIEGIEMPTFILDSQRKVGHALIGLNCSETNVEELIQIAKTKWDAIITITKLNPYTLGHVNGLISCLEMALAGTLTDDNGESRDIPNILLIIESQVIKTDEDKEAFFLFTKACSLFIYHILLLKEITLEVQLEHLLVLYQLRY